MVAEARNLLARGFARLEHGGAGGNLDLDAVDGERGHQSAFRAARMPIAEDMAIFGLFGLTVSD